MNQGLDREAKAWRDTVTTVLRAYQVCGPSEKDMETAWNHTIKHRITKPLDPVSKTCLLDGFNGIEKHFDSADNFHNIYVCGRLVRAYFDALEAIPKDQRKGIARVLSSLSIDLSVGDYSQLLKAGPHLANGKSLTSIFGESLDVHALSKTLLEEPSHEKSSFQRLHRMRLESKGGVEKSTDLPTFMKEYAKDLDHPVSMLDVLDRFNMDLVDSFKESLGSLGQILDLNYALKVPVGSVPDWVQLNSGRIVLLQDKAGKVRSIAIAGYLVNNALAPLHKGLQRLLGEIPQDSTDQEKGITKILEMTSKPDAYICSADLSAATDRLPAVLQAFVLYRVLRLSGFSKAENLAEAWFTIMTRLPYRDPFTSELVTYGAGQGMGIYTSWSMMALTNHILIRAAYAAAKDKSLKYLVCGDDTVIGAKAPFLLYQDCMNALGVTINSSKSHITEKSDPYKVAEFCKRLAVNGEIVSGESPKLLIRAARDEAYGPAAINCIQLIAQTHLSRKKLSSLVGARRLEERRLYIPYRYGGWGLIGTDPVHVELLRDNFIFLYIYKLMRGQISAAEHVLETDALDHSQQVIDDLSDYSYLNLYRDTDEPDWRLMNKKAYTPIVQMRSYLYDYESFLTGMLTIPPEELTQMVEDTFNKLKDCPIPVRLFSKEDKRTKSRESLYYQRLYTRASRNASKGVVSTYAFGVKPIDISIAYYDPDDSSLESKLLVEDLDQILHAV